VYDAAVPEPRPASATDPPDPPKADPGTAPDAVAPTAAGLSWFFPAHDEAENIEPLVEEALRDLPRLASVFEVICVDDGSTDGTGAIADRLAAAHPGVVRVVHHPVNLGYGAALRSGFGAARYPLVCFTDGDRQFRIADLGRLLARMDEPADAGAGPASARPDVVAGYRIQRADPAIRLAYARIYRACLRLFYGLRVRDVDCACKLFRREALEGIRLASGGAFLSAELLIKLRATGRSVVEVGVPHHPRPAGRPSGADPRVVLRAVRDFWRLRIQLWVRPHEALATGAPALGSAEPSLAAGATSD
jgi:glycosyltransferase involved in cell wall biosynthesis